MKPVLDPSPALPHVLFVCVENSCRSQMAEGFARAHAGGRVVVRSAGSRPSGRVNPRAVRFMAEAGVDLSESRSEGLDTLPEGVVWDHVITMGCGDACPDIPARHRTDWQIPDPRDAGDDEFRRIRDEIARCVKQLLDRLD